MKDNDTSAIFDCVAQASGLKKRISRNNARTMNNQIHAITICVHFVDGKCFVKNNNLYTEMKSIELHGKLCAVFAELCVLTEATKNKDKKERLEHIKYLLEATTENLADVFPDFRNKEFEREKKEKQ